MKRVMVLVPHIDDGEFGCGGTMAKMTEEGKEISYLAFSHPKGFDRELLIKELVKSKTILNIPFVKVFDYPVREFPACRQKILDDMLRERDKFNPDLVFMPSLNDTHQDHLTIVQEGIRAFKRKNILHYELPWNNFIFRTACFMPLEERHIEKKMKALECYWSQSGRAYIDRDFIYGLAKTRGVQIEVPYAEAFEVGRWIM